jgi:hypothetical protein
VSHIVEIQTEARDPVAVAVGSLVKLPGWLYLIVIDTSADCGSEKATMSIHFVLSQVAR